MSEELVYYPVGTVGEIPEGQGRAFDVDGRMVAVFLSGGSYFALDDACPHQGAPLSDGEVHDQTVTCHWHGWRFSLEDGRWLDSPRTKATTFPVRVIDGRIEVGVSG